MSRVTPKELIALFHQYEVPKSEHRYVARYWRDVRNIERNIAQQQQRLEAAQQRLRTELLRAGEAYREEPAYHTPELLGLLSMVPPPDGLLPEDDNATSSSKTR